MNRKDKNFLHNFHTCSLIPETNSAALPDRHFHLKMHSVAQLTSLLTVLTLPNQLPSHMCSLMLVHKHTVPIPSDSQDCICKKQQNFIFLQLCIVCNQVSILKKMKYPSTYHSQSTEKFYWIRKTLKFPYPFSNTCLGNNGTKY